MDNIAEEKKCSLLISTYNAPAFLNLCLQSVLRQSIFPQEIIIADDGSTNETARLIDSFRERTKIPIVRVWQEDEGYRLSKIRNKAFAKAKSAYIIQIDGDLILHPKFIADHLYLSKKDYFVTGSRALLSPEATSKLIAEDRIDVPFYMYGTNLNAWRNRRLSRFLADRYKIKKDKYYVKGCNMAFWKKDILAVNGYNEDFTGWGKEDSEIAARLLNKGIKKRFLKMGGVTYHLFHPFLSLDREKINDSMLQSAIESKSVWADNGIDAYLK